MARSLSHINSANEVTYAVLAALLVVAGVYCSLWVLSSASLACTACNCEYSLFASTLRCRQPAIAVTLAVASFGGAVLAFVAHWRLSHRDRAKPEQ